jgi:hypothetical protein
MTLKQKKPMARKTPLRNKAPMKAGGKPMARQPTPRASVIKRTAPIRKKAPKNAPTAAESRYMGLVAALGCAVCRRIGHGPTPAIVHHQRTGQGKMRASHYRTVPLCPPHHQGSGYGVHDRGREEWAALFGFTEIELVEETRTLLADYLPEDEKLSKVPIQ